MKSSVWRMILMQYPSNNKIYEKGPQYNATLYRKQILPVPWPWPFVILWFHWTTSVINKKKFTFENCSITESIFLNWLHIEDMNNFGKCFTKVSFERLNTTSRERLNLIWEKAPTDQQTAEMSVFTLLFSQQKEVKIKKIIIISVEHWGCKSVSNSLEKLELNCHKTVKQIP